MNYENRLYCILHPNQALIASHYPAELFAKHYLVGSTRYYSGKIIFSEIDAGFRDDYFNIDKELEGMVPHEDGSPKATKFISSYRVLEHIDFNRIKALYLATSRSQTLKLEPQAYDKSHQEDMLRIFAEITPLNMLVMSRLNFPEFGRYITRDGNPKGSPKLFYTQIELEIEEFLRAFEANPFMQPPIPFVHPSKLRDAIHFLTETKKSNLTKGLALSSSLNEISYRKLRHGFMFSSKDEHLFFPLPEIDEIEKINLKFWRDM